MGRKSRPATKARPADAVVLEAVAAQAGKAAKAHQAALAPGDYEVVDGHLEATIRQKGKRPKAVAYVFSGPVSVTPATPATRSPSTASIVAALFARLAPADRRRIKRAILRVAFDRLTREELTEARVWLAQLGESVPGKKPRTSAARMTLAPAD